MKQPMKFDDEVVRKTVAEFIDKTLKGVKCSVCKQPFETARQRDKAHLVNVKPLKFVHFECLNKEK